MFSGSYFMRFLFLLALLFSLAPARDASPESSPEWRDAMTAYKAKDYQKAADGFRRIAEDENQISAALCHNLANSEYKLGEALEIAGNLEEGFAHEALASLWYRRALALDPWLPEARQNLRFLHDNKLGFHRFEREGYMAIFSSWLPRARWMAICQGAIWCSVLMIVWLIWFIPRPGRRWPLVTVLCLTVACVITAICGLIWKGFEQAPLSKRIVCIYREAPGPIKDLNAPTVSEWKLNLLSAPAEAAKEVMSLKPGSELLPLRKEGYWLYCEVPAPGDSPPVRGWLREKNPAGQNVTEPLWPWNAALVD